MSDSMINNISPIIKLSLLTIPLTLAACSTMKVSPEARSAYDITQKKLASQPLSVISDGCVVRVELGKNDILYQQSDLSSIAMMNTVKEELSMRNLAVSRTSAPFVCGTYPEKVLKKTDIIKSLDSKELVNINYPILSSNNSFDAKTNQAYLDLFTAIGVLNKQDLKNAYGQKYNLGLSVPTLSALKQVEGTDKVFVSLLNASKPSFGYSMAMGVSTAVATGGTAYSIPQQGVSHSLYLVDLTTNSIDWSKSTSINAKVFKMPINERLEYENILEPLYTY